MSTRLDVAIGKFPAHEDGIRLLAQRDPSGNLKYLDWGAKMLASGQALAPEVGDVLDLFHKFAGQWVAPGVPGARHRREAARIHPDINTYKPQDLARLRDNLRKMQRVQDRKRKKREKLYKIEGDVEAEVVYDSDDLIVRHIKNKNASIHYGGSTQWCIAMRAEGYFEDYESNNATFFFWERKQPKRDEYDKVALMLPRGGDGGVDFERQGGSTAFTSTDRAVDMMALARVYGPRVFDIFRQVHERSEKHPGSVMSQVLRGAASTEQLRATYASIDAKMGLYELEGLLETICCNDAAPLSLLQDIAENGPQMAVRAWKRQRSAHARHGIRMRVRRMRGRGDELALTIMAALSIHPSVPEETRATIVKELKRRRINMADVHRTYGRDRVGIVYKRQVSRHDHYRRRFRRQMQNPRLLRARADMIARMAKRYRKKATKIERKLREKAKHKDKREKDAAKRKALKARGKVKR